MLKNWWKHYQQRVKGTTIAHISGNENDLSYWQDLLFFNFLFYCLPISFVAVIPSVYMAITDGYIPIAIVDLISLFLLSVVTFLHQISLRLRKLFIITIFYVLSVFLIASLGYVGPGVFYLFAITILIALVFPRNYAYWSILVNTVILLIFAFIIRFNLFGCPLNLLYSPGKWIAFSSNLIFLSIVLVALVNRIFLSLQHTIAKEIVLQERYKNIFDLSPIPMWTFDVASLKFLNVNEAAIRNYGYTEDEFLQMSIKNIRPESQAGALQELVDTNRKTGLFYQGNAEHVKKNGERIYVKIESNLLTYDDRQIRLVLATDVTDQLNNERDIYEANLKIKKSEASLRAIFESAADGFLLLDDSLTIKTFNSRAEELVLLNKNQPKFERGRNIMDYVETGRRSYFNAAIEKVFKGELVEYDRRYRPDAANFQWIRFTLTPVYEDQLVRGVCITGRDVTVRKLYLKNLEDQNKTFREISWMQSHLVRAPLARIMGLIDLLKTARDEDFEETIEYIIVSAHDLDTIINKITEKSNAIITKYPVPDDATPPTNE